MIAEAVSLSAVSVQDVQNSVIVVVFFKLALLAIACYFIHTFKSTTQRVALGVAAVACLVAGVVKACPPDMTPLIDCSQGKCQPVCVPSYDRAGLTPVVSPVVFF